MAGTPLAYAMVGVPFHFAVCFGGGIPTSAASLGEKNQRKCIIMVVLRWTLCILLPMIECLFFRKYAIYVPNSERRRSGLIGL